jgi:hypothetical protein
VVGVQYDLVKSTDVVLVIVVQVNFVLEIVDVGLWLVVFVNIGQMVLVKTLHSSNEEINYGC